MSPNYTNKVTIDPPSYLDTIISHISTLFNQRRIEGVVHWYVDSIESYLCVHIAKELVGAKKVKLLVPKGRFTKKQSLKKLKDRLNIPKDNILPINITDSFSQIHKELVKGEDILSSSNISMEPPKINYDLGYYLSRRIIYKEMEQQEFNPPVKKIPSQREEFLQRLVSHHKAQHRLRMLYCYLVAEKDYKAVFGSLNKTQFLTGLFSVHGHQYGADFLPLGDLYSSQIMELGEYLNYTKLIPAEKPATNPHHHDFFDMEILDLDNILQRLEEGYSCQEIHDDMDLELIKIQKVNYYYKVSDYSRNIPYSPPFENK